MGELGNGARLVAEAAAELRVVRQFVLENLDRHETVQPVTLRLVDVGHAAAADQLQDLIAIIEHFTDVLIHSLFSFRCS